MAAANYCLCDKCKAKTFYDSDVDYEDSNLGAMAALCKDCAQTHEITIAKRGEIAELRAAAAAYLEALADRKTTKSYVQHIDDFRAARARVRETLSALRAALAATEGAS